MSHVSAPTARTILVVDDERAVREYARLVLEDAGYLVLTAADGREGLDLAGRLGRRLHLLVTDLLMPGMDGRRLAAQLRARRPDLPVVFMTGLGSGDQLVEPATAASVAEAQIGTSRAGAAAAEPALAATTIVLPKPFTADRLEGIVVAVLGGPVAGSAAGPEAAWAD